MAKVLIAIPTSGGMHERTSMAAAALMARHNAYYTCARGRPVDYVRNSFIRMFKGQGFSHLFLLDSDTEPPLDCIDRLLALDAPIAGGCYPALMPDKLCWALLNQDSDRRWRLLESLPSMEEPFEVDGGGAGCLLIRFDVFDKIKWPWFKWIERADGSQISEDVRFFMKLKKAGIRVKIDPMVICNHFKEINLTTLMLCQESKKHGKESK
jgi:hypothetical protein